jgi:hypothetical protein
LRASATGFRSSRSTAEASRLSTTSSCCRHTSGRSCCWPSSASSASCGAPRFSVSSSSGTSSSASPSTRPRGSGCRGSYCTRCCRSSCLRGSGCRHYGRTDDGCRRASDWRWPPPGRPGRSGRQARSRTAIPPTRARCSSSRRRPSTSRAFATGSSGSTATSSPIGADICGSTWTGGRGAGGRGAGTFANFQWHTLIVTDVNRPHLLPFLRGYRGRRFHLRVWWVVDYSGGSLREWARWFVHRRQWGPLGSTDQWLYVRKAFSPSPGR